MLKKQKTKKKTPDNTNLELITKNPGEERQTDCLCLRHVTSLSML